MLTAYQLTKSFNIDILFENVCFSLNQGDRVGLIGPNGCGKTTLLRILAGLEKPDSGSVWHDPDLRIGYLEQGSSLDADVTLAEVIGQAVGNVQEMEDELAVLAQRLVARPDDPLLQRRYDDLLQRIQSAEMGRAGKILSGLGLAALERDMPVAWMSGGQKTRLGLALVLLGEPQLILMDEPTNHLDIAMLEWLEDWLVSGASARQAMLIVSHDRMFLDRTVNRILVMDEKLHQVREYPGNYSAYEEQRQVEIENQWAEYRDQQAEIKKMRQDILRLKTQAAYTERQASSIRIGGAEMKNVGVKTYHQAIAKKVARKAKAREKKLDRYLGSDERVEKPQQSWRMKLGLNQGIQPLGKAVFRLRELSVGYDTSTPLIREINLDVQRGQRIVLTGPNGCGKTSLLRTIVGEIAPLQGAVEMGSSVRLGWMSQDQAELDLALNPVETILRGLPMIAIAPGARKAPDNRRERQQVQPPLPANETEARRYLSYYLFTGDEALKPNAWLSYGQRARLMLALLELNGCNCLLLDEPINHLDIPSRAEFEQVLASYKGTILAVVHDRYFIKRFASDVWWVDEGRIRT